MQLKASDVTLLNINRASVLLSYNNDTFLMSTKFYNRLLKEDLEGDFVNKNYVKGGMPYTAKWFAVLSIF